MAAARNAALFLLLLAAMWLSSLWLYDQHKMQHALEWREAVLNGQSPFRWTFNSRSDITSGHGIDEFEWRGGELHGDLDAARGQQQAISKTRLAIQDYGPIPAQKRLLAIATGDARWANVRPPLDSLDEQQGDELLAALGGGAAG